MGEIVTLIQAIWMFLITTHPRGKNKLPLLLPPKQTFGIWRILTMLRAIVPFPIPTGKSFSTKRTFVVGMSRDLVEMVQRRVICFFDLQTCYLLFPPAS